jgi:hypothetical protein
VTDVAFVVVQGMAPAVAGIARLLPVLEGLGSPASRQRLVLNYNYKPFLGNLRPPTSRIGWTARSTTSCRMSTAF